MLQSYIFPGNEPPEKIKRNGSSNMAVKREDIHHFNYFLYGEAFYGSKEGIRYRIGIEPLENVFFKKPEEREGHKIRAYVWKEPDNFATAKDKLSMDFDFSEEGVCAAIDWINLNS